MSFAISLMEIIRLIFVGITVKENELEAVHPTEAKRIISRRNIIISWHEIAVSCHDTMVSNRVTFTGLVCDDLNSTVEKVKTNINDYC